MATKVWLGTTDSDVTTAGNWSPSGQPTAGDDVIITGSVAITGATLSSAGNLASFVIRDYTGIIGSEAADLVIDLAASSNVSIDTTSKAYLDFNASDVDVDVHQTATTTGTASGLHLKGSSINDLNVYNSGSSVLVVEDTLDGDINTYHSGATVTLAAAAVAVNYNGPGRLYAHGSLTNIFATGSDVDYYGSGAITTAKAEKGATINYYSSANITNAYAYGGTIDGSMSNETVTSTNNDVQEGGSIKPGPNWTLTNNPTTGYIVTTG